MGDDLQSKAAEMMKKVLTVGVGAFFLTEESLRGLVSESKLPKELLAGILDSANKNKAEFLKNFSKEILDRLMNKVDLEKLLEEVIRKNQIELNIQVNSKQKTPEDKKES